MYKREERRVIARYMSVYPTTGFGQNRKVSISYGSIHGLIVFQADVDREANTLKIWAEIPHWQQ